MIRGIHHVAVHVHDLDRMIAFYKSAFGFEVVGEVFSWANDALIDRIVSLHGSAARGAMLKAGNCYFELFEYAAPAPHSVRALDPNDKGYTHFCVDVTDIEHEFQRLSGLGMTFSQPQPIDAGHVKTIYGRDPEGNIIEIQETAPTTDFAMDRLTPDARPAPR